MSFITAVSEKHGSSCYRWEDQMTDEQREQFVDAMLKRATYPKRQRLPVKTIIEGLRSEWGVKVKESSFHDGWKRLRQEHIRQWHSGEVKTGALAKVS